MSSNVTFDTPPPVLTPGEVITLNASGSVSGSAEGDWNPGEQFEYRADGVDLEGETYLSMGINPELGPTSGSVSPQFPVPAPWGETAEIQIHAFYWNCAACLRDTGLPAPDCPAYHRGSEHDHGTRNDSATRAAGVPYPAAGG